MLFGTTYCIYKSTSYIYLFNNCKEKYTFSTRPRVLRDQISQECVWVLKLLWPENLHALLVWQRNYHLNSFIYKKAIEVYCDLWKLFHSKWTEIIVETQLLWFWLTNIICLLSDNRKEEIIRSMNLIDGFGARGYSIREIYLPIVLLT